MVFAYSEDKMEDIRLEAYTSSEIKNLGYVQLERGENHRFAYKTGKPLYSFIFIRAGAMSYRFPTLKKTIVLEKDTALYIPKLLPYETTYLQNGTKIKILTFDMEKNDDLNSLSKPIVTRSPEATLVFSSISKQNMHSALFLSAKIYELLHLIKTTDSAIPKKYRALAPALDELQREYFKNEKISYYAQLCGMSESNFRKLFKEYTGKSPIEYRNLIRISAVKTLLNSSELTVSEAAYLVGFNNMSYFYEVYNKY